jgi:LuxR family quorum sensing-dependent transcriptional regulator
MHSISSVLYWKDRLRPFSMVLSSKRAELHLLMIYFIQQCIKLKAAESHGALERPRDLRAEVVDGLTAAQRDVLSWAARGKTVGETAEILRVSELTVETHIKNALRRLDVHNKTHAVAKAIMLGLIDY